MTTTTLTKNDFPVGTTVENEYGKFTITDETAAVIVRGDTVVETTDYVDVAIRQVQSTVDDLINKAYKCYDSI